MFDFQGVLTWLLDPENWEGRYGLPNLVAEHLSLTLLAIGLAALFALPLGLGIGHTGKGGAVVVLLGSASRAIPTMGLLFALVMLMGVELRELAVVLALVAMVVGIGLVIYAVKGRRESQARDGRTYKRGRL